MGHAGESIDALPEWAGLAIARAGPSLQPALSALLQFDRQLGRVILGATEPMLAQIRIAWWREELARSSEQAGRPRPVDPLLNSLLDTTLGGSAELVTFIDGWETLLEAQPWSLKHRERYAAGHSAVFERCAQIAGSPGCAKEAGTHGEAWAQAKLARFDRTTPPATPPDLPRLPRDLRAIAMIGGLSRRALLRGGEELMGDRMSPFAALRLGIFGT